VIDRDVMMMMTVMVNNDAMLLMNYVDDDYCYYYDDHCYCRHDVDDVLIDSVHNQCSVAMEAEQEDQQMKLAVYEAIAIEMIDFVLIFV